jgi:hypothetical protein
MEVEVAISVRYLARAWRYEQHPDEPERVLTLVLLRLGGEVGSLKVNLKRTVRTTRVHLGSDTLAVEDLGAVLRAAPNTTWLGSDLSQVAVGNPANLMHRAYPHDRRTPQGVPLPSPLLRPSTISSGPLGPAHIFDSHYGEAERLPRQLRIHIAEIPDVDATSTLSRVLPIWDGRPCGDVLSDNAYDDDGYRYHDAFHLAYVTVLGWSPVVRALLGRKRKTTPRIDEVEDGGRAIAIEEGLSLFVFEAASRAGYYEAVNRVDSNVLHLCRRLTAKLEVGVCTSREWERAILDGYSTWRLLRKHGHAAVHCDLDTRILSARPLTARELAEHADVCRQARAEQAGSQSRRAG